MTIDRQSFFDVMASFPSGVAIVTTVDGLGVPRGLTTTAVCSVSAAPPTILVCLDQGSRTLAALRERRGFVVNFIGEGRSELCLLFASKEEDKFRRVAWTETSSGLPLLHEDALAWAACATVDEIEAGDHVVLVARVEDGGVRPELGPPLHVLPPLVGGVVAGARAGRARRGRDHGDRDQCPRPPLAGSGVLSPVSRSGNPPSGFPPLDPRLRRGSSLKASPVGAATALVARSGDPQERIPAADPRLRRGRSLKASPSGPQLLLSREAGIRSTGRRRRRSGAICPRAGGV